MKLKTVRLETTKLWYQRLLALALALSLPVGVPTAAVTAIALAAPAGTETSPAEAQPAADSGDSETDRGWIGIVAILAAAGVIITAIAVGVNFLQKRK